MLYKNSRFKRIIFSENTTNLKTTISQRSLRNLGLLLLLLKFNNFSFLLDIKLHIYNIINTSCHVTRTPTNCSAIWLWRDSVTTAAFAVLNMIYLNLLFLYNIFRCRKFIIIVAHIWGEFYFVMVSAYKEEDSLALAIYFRLVRYFKTHHYSKPYMSKIYKIFHFCECNYF